MLLLLLLMQIRRERIEIDSFSSKKVFFSLSQSSPNRGWKFFIGSRWQDKNKINYHLILLNRICHFCYGRRGGEQQWLRAKTLLFDIKFGRSLHLAEMKRSEWEKNKDQIHQGRRNENFRRRLKNSKPWGRKWQIERENDINKWQLKMIYLSFRKGSFPSYSLYCCTQGNWIGGFSKPSRYSANA